MPFNSREFDIVKAAVSCDIYRQEQHQDDAAVDALAAAMKTKLAKQRANGYGGWDTPECTQQRLSDMLRAHVDKGDPVDVANFCAFLAARGEGIAQATSQQEPSYTAVQLAEMVLSDCGHSSNNTGLLDRVSRRIDAHVQRCLDELQYCLESKPTPKPSTSQADTLDAARSLFDAGWKACTKFCDRDDVIYDGIVGSTGCPQFENAFDAVWAAQQDKS